jgi:O-methyltransferase
MNQMRVTVLTPHMRQASGGPQELANFARHLAPLAKVTLVVIKGSVPKVAGVEGRAVPLLQPDRLPDADALVFFAGLPAGARLRDLPARKGVPIAFFQGHHPYVDENLQRVRQVLAIAPYLVADARRMGCDAHYVERAVDRAVWFPGPPQAERPLSAAMMVNPAHAKGTADGLAALERVQELVPGLEVHLFGEAPDEPIPDSMRHHGVLHRDDVAAMMRRVSVVVCPSHLEGFGLTGLEAIASGAALATTDTRGSRGYAVHRDTALVSPPRDVDALSAHVAELVDDVSLRTRLAESGLRHVDAAYLTWPEAARRLCEQIRNIVEQAPLRPAPDELAAPIDYAGPDRYVRLLKKTLTGAVHQEAFGIITDPALVVGAEIGKAVADQDIVLGRRLSGDERRAMTDEGRDWPLAAETMVGGKRLDQLEKALTFVLQNHIPGDVIEAGVWRGGAAIFMRGFLAAHGVADRRVFVADSFEGVPPPAVERYPADAGDEHHELPMLAVDIATVRENFRRYGLLDDQVVFVKGRFGDTLPKLKGNTWAVVRLDGDMYESTMDGLVNLYPGLSIGGHLIVDDYGAIPAAAKAVDDFREEHRITSPLHQIDWTGVFWQKVEPLTG